MVGSFVRFFFTRCLSFLYISCLIYYKNNDNNKRKTLFICSQGMQGLNLNARKSMLKVGSVIVINCTVIGGPISLNITWFKEGEKIVLSHRRKITTVEHQSRLTIRNVMAQDEGEYHCRAR